MAAQHLPRDLVWPSSGFNNSLKRRRTVLAIITPRKHQRLADPLLQSSVVTHSSHV